MERRWFTKDSFHLLGHRPSHHSLLNTSIAFASGRISFVEPLPKYLDYHSHFQVSSHGRQVVAVDESSYTIDDIVLARNLSAFEDQITKHGLSLSNLLRLLCLCIGPSTSCSNLRCSSRHDCGFHFAPDFGDIIFSNHIFVWFAPKLQVTGKS